MAHSRPSWNGSVSLSMALKASLLFLLLVSLVLLAKLSVPYASRLILSGALSSAWLAPPYLFITVHFIILLIWKLSDHKPNLQRPLSPQISPHAPSLRPAEPAVPPKHNLPAVIKQQHHQWDPQEEKPSLPKQSRPRDVPHRASLSDDGSCMTDDDKSDHKTTASSHLDMRRSEKPQPVLEKQSLRKPELGLEEPAVVEEGEADADDSMDATWKAIMAKTSRPVVATASGATEPEISVGADELNQRFEDFIKKSRDQIRLQAEEPNRHRRQAMHC